MLLDSLSVHLGVTGSSHHVCPHHHSQLLHHPKPCALSPGTPTKLICFLFLMIHCIFHINMVLQHLALVSGLMFTPQLFLRFTVAAPSASRAPHHGWMAPSVYNHACFSTLSWTGSFRFLLT